MSGMKLKFKLGDILLLIGTLAAVILSIILWIFIMTNNQYFSHINQTSNVTEQSHSRNRIISNLFVPTSSYGFQNGQLYNLYDAKKNLPLEFSNELKDVKYGNIEKISSSRHKYEQMLNNSAYVQLTFPNEVSVNLLTKKDVTKNDQKFRRIFISPSNFYFYLGSDKSTTIYRVGLIKADFSRLRSYARNAHGRQPVKFVRLNDSYEVFYTQTEHWRVYSYLTNSQPDSYFVTRLLGTANVTARSSKKGWTTYSLNYYTKLRAPNTELKEADFLYSRYEKSKVMSTNERLLDSVEYVHKLGLSEQDLRYFDYSNGSVSYANYIEGLPVFLSSKNPQITTRFAQDAIEIAFNNTDLQIPIPFDGQTRTLPPSETVVHNLVNAGLKKAAIQRVIVAYRVEKDHSHDNLINLIPVYYVKAYNQWRSAAEWEKYGSSGVSQNQLVKGN